MLNKGFVLTDMLVVLVILGMINILTLRSGFKNEFNGKINTSLVSQSLHQIKLDSMLNMEHGCLDSDLVLSNTKVCFNNKGNINQAQTLEIIKSDKVITLFLGSGVHEIK